MECGFLHECVCSITCGLAGCSKPRNCDGELLLLSFTSHARSPPSLLPSHPSSLLPSLLLTSFPPSSFLLPFSVLQASMLTEPNGPFIDVAKLNLARYASRPALARALFEYLFHHENDVRSVSAGRHWTMCVRSDRTCHE